ncbi:glycosyltransferase involved in cell wall biosynthesis [Phycicoccus duodecadis]|uniref:Glycosyltransferase involved in cell wall biosynthesis n=1 Tax=Phycicoccus duodecadis TaxID=173053 RepID=A0A2N3YK98_9MICO|nr:glycosyltransferase involved in cell wall biosynthesis [Phycicoccus duodecadis]
MSPLGAGATEGPARVLMMVGNDISHDTRVLKMGLALSAAGVDVTLLGYASSGRYTETVLGDMRVIRVPIAWQLRDAEARRRAAVRARHLNLGIDSAVRRAQDLRSTLRHEEAAVGGPATKLRGRGARAGREVTRVRQGLDRRVKALEGRLWRGYDGALSRVPAGASWRRLLPEIDDYQLAFGPVIDRLEWDVLHAHDIHLVGVASRAVARRRAAGRPAAWVYDAHEYVAGLSLYGGRTKRKRAAYLDLESEYVHDADAVVTVTPALAETLQERYDLPELPTVVMNSPVLGAGSRPVETTIREACGLAPDQPLAVYSGGVTTARGVDTAVRALPLLPDVHLAVVCVPHKEIRSAKVLSDLAAELGVSDRLHLLDPVRPEEVSAFVATADVGLLPFLHFGSHEVALANKLFEYLYAGLPVLASDCRAQKEFVEEYRVGAVHVAGDPEDLARGVREVLEHGPALRRRILDDPELLVPFAWDRQEAALRAFYGRVLGPGRVHEPEHVPDLDSLVETPATRADRPSVVGIGPANMAGQAWAWAKGLERSMPGVRTEVVATDRGGPITFPADELVPVQTYAKDRAWAERFQERALDTWTHALLEAGRPLFGLRNGRDFTGDADVLRAVGISVGLILHGSEIRDPAQHARHTPWSPFRDPTEELTARLQKVTGELAPLVHAFDGPVFVSTPDLLLDVPEAHWLPVVVDVDAWASDAPLLERRVPVALHAPSRAALKGSGRVDALLTALHDKGVIEYRRIEHTPPSEMPRLIADADLVLDQFAIGTYGALALEAMSAGRLVLSNVTDQVRDAAGGPPIIEATPDTLEDVIRSVLDDRDAARRTAAEGTAFARAHHDGRRSARVLHDVLGVRGDTPEPESGP